MAKTNVTPPADAHAFSFLGFAEQYQKAANLLHESDKTLRIPTYFLYMHAIELALKAFLRATDLPVATEKSRKHHRITKLYEECRGLGLIIDSDDKSVIGLLEGANREEGLRYFRMESLSIPDLSWTRDVVEKLLRAVEPSVKKKAEADGIVPGRPVKFDFTWR